MLVNESLDPQHTLDANEDIYVASMFELLCEMNTSFTAEPRLAESWQPNDELTEWTFVTRSGVKFHDGEPFTARDAAYTLSRISIPTLGRSICPLGATSLIPTGSQHRMRIISSCG